MPLKPFSRGRPSGGRFPLWFALLAPGSRTLRAGSAPAPAPPPPDQTLTPDQLDDLVAPIALYPDPLLSQIMVAATYPLEVVQAYQWMQRNPGLTGPALTQAAQQQNWDPSVQALVVFPDVMKRLNDDVTWTTNLGNAFLAQQQDVMDAVQRMRQSAQQAGKLAIHAAGERGHEQSDTAQPVIDIEPADPDVIYVPVYDPVWIWGPPLWYPYPRWYWPPRTLPRRRSVLRLRCRHQRRLLLRRRLARMGRLGLASRMGQPYRDRQQHVHSPVQLQHRAHCATCMGPRVWPHDPAHRAGVPYAQPGLSDQYRGNVRQNVAPRSDLRADARRARSQPSERFGNREIPQRLPQRTARAARSAAWRTAAPRRRMPSTDSPAWAPQRSAPAPRRAAPRGARRRRRRRR